MQSQIFFFSNCFNQELLWSFNALGQLCLSDFVSLHLIFVISYLCVCACTLYWYFIING